MMRIKGQGLLHMLIGPITRVTTKQIKEAISRRHFRICKCDQNPLWRGKNERTWQNVWCLAPKYWSLNAKVSWKLAQLVHLVLWHHYKVGAAVQYTLVRKLCLCDPWVASPLFLSRGAILSHFLRKRTSLLYRTCDCYNIRRFYPLGWLVNFYVG